jgi:hypothetical protein
VSEPDVRRRLLHYDPVAIITALTALVAVIGSYFGLKYEIDDAQHQIANIQIIEHDRRTEHDVEWKAQDENNGSQQAQLSQQKEDLAVLRAELDGLLIKYHPAHP